MLLKIWRALVILFLIVPIYALLIGIAALFVWKVGVPLTLNSFSIGESFVKHPGAAYADGLTGINLLGWIAGLGGVAVAAFILYLVIAIIGIGLLSPIANRVGYFFEKLMFY
jgi:hypothetical protein